MSFGRGNLNRYLHQQYNPSRYIAVFGDTIVFSCNSNSCRTSGFKTLRGSTNQIEFTAPEVLFAFIFSQTRKPVKMTTYGSHSGFVMAPPTRRRIAGTYIWFLASRLSSIIINTMEYRDMQLMGHNSARLLTPSLPRSCIGLPIILRTTKI